MSTTPKNVRKQSEASSEKASGKKLVQARLPFKIIASAAAASSSSPAREEKLKETIVPKTKESSTVSEARKRKLSSGTEESEVKEDGITLRRNSRSKETLLVATKKKKTCDETEEGVVLLVDSCDENDAANNVDETLKKKATKVKTPKTSGKEKQKGVGTPNSANKPQNSATKLLIKLPLSGSKRRKSKRISNAGGGDAAKEDDKAKTGKDVHADSSDDNETIAKQLNPKKRPKMEGTTEEKNEPKSVEIIDIESEPELPAETKKSAAKKSSDSEKIKDSTKKSGKNGASAKKVSTIEKSTKKTESKKENKLTGGKLNKVKHDIFALRKANDKKVPEKQSNHFEDADSDVIEVKDSKSKQSEDETGEKPGAEVESKMPTTKKVNSDIIVVKDSKSKQSRDGTREKSEVEVECKIMTPKKGNEVIDIKSSVSEQSGMKVSASKEVQDAVEKKNINSKQSETTTSLSAEAKTPQSKSSISEKVTKSDETNEKDVVASIYSSSESDCDAQEVQSAESSVETANGEETSKSDVTKALVSNKMGESNSIPKKNMTPKQLKLMEQRRKVREEKERKLQEERMQKQREKEEKELSRKREREEKEEQRSKEREEKRKEREEKERKRLAEIEVKNEEKRKRTEAKEEELRKKEEERKRKDQEKEEAEMKKRKEIAAFSKFFVPKSTRTTTSNTNTTKNAIVSKPHEASVETLAFRPFQIKGDMKLAPLCRKVLTQDARKTLDKYFCKNDDDDEEEEIVRKRPLSKSHFYLAELQSGKVVPYKWRRRNLTEAKEAKLEDDDDVLIVEDELERAAQAIVEEPNGPIEHHRAKFYKFWENRRPPFYGTWRKKTTAITPRRPFVQDKNYFDYEVDSDLEWEEEEPGESLEDGSDEDKEKESEDEDYEVDNEWFVPHGHLSEEEMQNEDEFGVGDANDNDREAQKAKLKLLQQEFAQEMKKKTEKIKPRLIGCIWVDENGSQPELCPKIIWDTLNQRAMLCAVPPLLEEPEMTERSEPRSPSNNGDRTTDKLKPIALNERLQMDLVRLVHGNSHAKVFLINEFIAYVEANEEAIKNGEARAPHKSTVREKIDEFAEWQATELNVSKNKKKKAKKRLCWIVSADVLKRMNLESIGVNNAWQYTLQPKYTNNNTEATAGEAKKPAEKDEKDESKTTTTTEQPSNADDVKVEGKSGVNCRRNLEITKYTKVLTAEEKAKQMQSKLNESKASTTTEKSQSTKSVTVAAAAPTAAATVRKRVPLLMSVARGQQIPQPAKNALINKYLKNTADAKLKLSQAALAAENDHVIDDDLVILD